MDHQQDEVLELLDTFRTIRNTLVLDTAYIAKLIAVVPAEERNSLRTTLQLTEERISEYAAIIQYFQTGQISGKLPEHWRGYRGTSNAVLKEVAL